jgi:hypothetical protein
MSNLTTDQQNLDAILTAVKQQGVRLFKPDSGTLNSEFG